VPFLAMLLAQFVLIIIDRALYLRKQVVGKFFFHIFLVVLVHVWIFFVLPHITGRSLVVVLVVIVVVVVVTVIVVVIVVVVILFIFFHVWIFFVLPLITAKSVHSGRCRCSGYVCCLLFILGKLVLLRRVYCLLLHNFCSVVRLSVVCQPI